MLFDRDPKWTLFSDKLMVRDYVADKVGDKYLIPLLWSGKDPDLIPFEELPEKFVIKTNHGCGYNLFVKNKKLADKQAIKNQLKEWLSKNFTFDSFLGMAWAYKNIDPTIIIETFLEENGKNPTDYKFYCYSGKAKYVLIIIERFIDFKQIILDVNFNPLVVYDDPRVYKGKIERPVNYEEMVKVAEALASGLEFIRVDLYGVKNKVYFGEFTCYPAAGLDKFTTIANDEKFGKDWHISRGK